MNNVFDDMRDAVEDAKRTLRAADFVATGMAKTLLGRLRHVDSRDTLIALKRELQDFDAHRKEWKK